jgi:hypothetical protein
MEAIVVASFEGIKQRVGEWSKVECLTTSEYSRIWSHHTTGRKSLETTNRRRGLRFDKAFAVYLVGDQGIARGIARNISEGGMFIETREPFPLGSRIKVTFVATDEETELTVLAEVRYQCFLSYGDPSEGPKTPNALRGMGVRFVEIEEDQPSLFAPGGAPRARTLH